MEDPRKLVNGEAVSKRRDARVRLALVPSQVLSPGSKK